jgi:hypothetical protein
MSREEGSEVIEQQSELCPRCKEPVATGDRPTTLDGYTYCCDGCAEGGVCSCSKHEHDK